MYSVIKHIYCNPEIRPTRKENKKQTSVQLNETYPKFVVPEKWTSDMYLYHEQKCDYLSRASLAARGVTKNPLEVLQVHNTK